MVSISNEARLLEDMRLAYNMADYEVGMAFIEMEKTREKFRIAIDKRDGIKLMASELLRSR